MLTDHFDLPEFLQSQVAIRAGRIVEPTETVIVNLTRLCRDVLEPIRASVGKPINISSGYRPDWLNTMIGGSKKSQHMTGCAADISVEGIAPLILARQIRDLKLPGLNQCILEYPPNGWVHVSVAEAGATPRYQFLTARLSTDHRVVYSTGLSPA